MTTGRQRRSRERARQRTMERLEQQRARMKGEEKRPDPPFHYVPPAEGQIIIIDDYVRPLPYFGGKTMKRLRKQIAEALALPSSFWATDTTSLLDIFNGEDK